MTQYTPIETAPATGWTHAASNGIAAARQQDAFNDALALGLSPVEANQIAHWVYQRNMTNRGF